MRTKPIEANSRVRIASGLAAPLDELTSTRPSIAVRAITGLIVVITDGEGRGTPVAQEAGKKQ